MRRLVCLAPYVPYRGIDHAGGHFLYEYLCAAHETGWGVDVICPETPSNRAVLSATPPWATVLLVPTPSVSLPGRARRALLYGLSGDPEAWLAGVSEEALATLSNADVIDLQWLESIQLSKVLRARFPDKPVVAHTHDVASEGILRGLSSPSLRTRLRSLAALVGIRRLERQRLNHCDRVFVFNPDDRQKLRALGVRTDLRVAPAAVQRSALTPTPASDGHTILFVGAFWRPENDEAARWFIRRVWPVLEGRLPSAVVRLAGAGPRRWLQDLASERVEVTGYLDDVMDAYVGVSLVIAPLRRGAGLKFKVVEALASGYPVIGTSVAAEGLDTLLGEAAVEVHDDAQGFADAVCAAFHDLPGRLAAAAELAERVRSRLDFDRLIRDQLASYEDIVAGAR